MGGSSSANAEDVSNSLGGAAEGWTVVLVSGAMAGVDVSAGLGATVCEGGGRCVFSGVGALFCLFVGRALQRECASNRF